MNLALALMQKGLAAVVALGVNYTFTVVPSQPVAGQAFEIRITQPFDGCGIPLPPLIDTADLGNGVIRYAIPGYDYCELNVPSETRSYSVPALPAGIYTFQFAACGLFPVDCHTFEERVVTVLPAPRRFTVPGLTPVGAAVSIMLLAAAAIVNGRRRR